MMTLEEISQLIAAQQMIATRHDREIDRINETLDRVARLNEETSHKAALNQEAIANLNASIQELRNIVSDYIQGRS
jgi:uncharacterized coiled-coil protein SlyX